ncbi:hypothetical protein DMP06_08685, partial [Slackia equolifaciens]
MHIRGSIAAIHESITKMTCIIGEFTDGDCGRKVGRDSRVRKGVRMYDRDVVELALLALEEGMTHAEAA